MGKNASDVLIETIMGWGVDTVFGIPGDGINGVMEALRERKDRIRFIQTRHEEGAAFMACGYAKYTGRLGCCLATSGPGAIHLLNGLYDAKTDQAPVLAITGQTFSDLQGSMFQQDVNTTLLFQDVAGYNQEVINPLQVEMLANEACRRALNDRAVSHISFPVDYQDASADGHGSMHAIKHMTTNTWDCTANAPAMEDLEAAAKILNGASRPVILVGQGALRARAEVIELAELLGAPIVKALLGKAVVADDHPYCTGGLGLLGTAPSVTAMEDCDAILLIGTSFPYMEFLPKHDQAVGIQIDDKADRIGLRYPVEVGLVGDSKVTLQALLPLIVRNENRKFIEKIQGDVKGWHELMLTREREETPIKPQQIARVLSDLATDDCIVSTDSGTITSWIARH